MKAANQDYNVLFNKVEIQSDHYHLLRNKFSK